MDDMSFDRMTRLFVGRATRREAVAASAAAGATLITSFGANAKLRCRPEGQSCRKGGECCSGVCEKPSQFGRSVCAPDPKPDCVNVVCGDVCCPPEVSACAVLDLPGGPITCQCPRGFEYVDCKCMEIECPSGTNCSGSIRCGNVSNDNFCCSFPQAAYCSCQSPITGGQVAGCCTPGVDCPADLGWENYAWGYYVGPCVEDGVVICCCATEECQWSDAAIATCGGV